MWQVFPTSQATGRRKVMSWANAGAARRVKTSRLKGEKRMVAP
jgi:hypothetical protein